MNDIASHYKGTIRAGQVNPFAGSESLSSVYHDQKITYYDLTDLQVSADEFADFVAAAWGSDNEKISLDYVRQSFAAEWPESVHVVNLD
jgi:hypothetical protein